MHLELLRIEMNYLKLYINIHLNTNVASQLDKSILCIVTSFVSHYSYDLDIINHAERIENIYQHLHQVLDTDEYAFLIANTMTILTLLEKIKF
ncbi:hypothetical protein [Anaerophilus nitritogenes]|uniref:hypothetical protein n=1 Tax=Anaerophilus nitritogenes TaxID=2498136 RepID=UPI00101C348A|nr:hypothetical protein [Anaerophilus nitritogenes]